MNNNSSFKYALVVLSSLFMLPTVVSNNISNTHHGIYTNFPSKNDKVSKGYLNLSKAELLDKIKGGWAGQTIGVTYGGPTEFKFMGRIIPDSVEIPWYKGYLKNTMIGMPWLYDDIYMDLTFVEIIDKLGVNAPIDSFAYAFANAPYELWHAN